MPLHSYSNSWNFDCIRPGIFTATYRTFLQHSTHACFQQLRTHVKPRVKTKRKKGRQPGASPLLVESCDCWHRSADLSSQTLSMCALSLAPGWAGCGPSSVRPLLLGSFAGSKHPLMLCFVKVAFWRLGLPLSLADLIYAIFFCCAPYSFTVHLIYFFSTASVALHSLFRDLFVTTCSSYSFLVPL